MGAPFQAVVAFHGDFALGVTPLNIGIESLYADGFNLYSRGRGDTINASDPTGLFTAIDIMDAGLNALQTGLDVGGAALYGQAMQDAVDNTVMMHQIMTIADLDWAMDWSRSDDEFYGSGISAYQAAQIDAGVSTLGPRFASVTMEGIPGTRPIADQTHGGQWHNDTMHAWAQYAQARFGEGNVRFNQATYDWSKGKNGSRLRPDIAVWDPKAKKWTILEIIDTHGVRDRIARENAVAAGLGLDRKQIQFEYINARDFTRGRRLGFDMKTASRIFSTRPRR